MSELSHLDALEAEGFQVNPDLYSVYEKSEA